MDIRYFMYECTEWEVNNILECIPWTDRNLWETARLNSFLVAKANFKGIKDLKDICKFPWDDYKTGDIEITEDDKQKAEAFAEKIFGHKWLEKD